MICVRDIKAGLLAVAALGLTAATPSLAGTTDVSTAGAEPKHWAFRPVRAPKIPDVDTGARIGGAVDAFVWRELAEQGLDFGSPARPERWLRRVYFDLVGLPPAPEDVERFLADSSPAARERVVDTLLASPRYGERWGRHWLDVARYADNKGYVFEEERKFPYAYSYRDWVVRSLNEDLPYDRFVLAQIAGDSVAEETGDRSAYAAMGFLTLGRRFLNREPDIIDDRIDVMSRGFMGLTVACARCHDHKFDPIPIEDYYSLYGVFASSEEPDELPLLTEEPPATAEYAVFAAGLREREEKSERYLKEREDRLRSAEGVAAYLQLCYEGRDLPEEAFQSEAQKRKLYQRIAERWRRYLAETAERNDPVFAAWHAFAGIETQAWNVRAAEKAAELAESESAHPALRVELRKGAPASMAELAQLYGRVLAEADAEQAHADGEREDLRSVLRAEGAPAAVSSRELYRLLNTPEQQEVRRLRREAEEYRAVSEGAPPRGMALVDRKSSVDPVVFERGDSRRPGDRVPRQFLEALSGPERTPFGKGSGRRELAEAIADEANPLTARVLVNRVWQHHFGAPLVESPSDFGVRTPPPAQPELLDYLAARFMAEGWSLKALHRWIILSEVYGQSSDDRADGMEKDPENRLYWKFARKRLEFEALRDAMLQSSGRLDDRMGGRPEELRDDGRERRRTLYTFIDRQNLPGVFRTFDFANPDAHSPRRAETTAPQQALYLMNHPFAAKQAESLVSSPDFQTLGLLEERVRLIYLRLLGREPEGFELGTAEAFLEGRSEDDAAWRGYVQALYCTNEFAFTD
ncbi:MAG TPA: DUF1549 and DUF1553 domain-containing protein [Verrucomicrobiales bacterium]|nr:DUF1549 and DUF1553 domain-containing protein [Verrucomicrobiales bacterium]